MAGLHSAFLREREVEKLLQLAPGELDHLLEEDEDFPRGSKVHDSDVDWARGREAHWRWDGGQVYEWAARSTRFRERGAALLDPTLETRAITPAKWVGFQPTSQGPAMDWETDLGVVRLLYTTRPGAARALTEELTEEAGAQGVITVCALWGDIGFSGPALVAADTAQPSLEYEAQWGRVTKLIGQPLPWWPGLLRRADVISQWSPGAPVTIADVLPDEREAVLRQAASVWRPSDAARNALTDLANSLRNERISRVNREIDIFGEAGAHPQGDRLLVAARHRTKGYPLPRTNDRELLAEGWRHIASSQLFEAYEPLSIVMHCDPGLLPFGPHVEVSAHSPAARRWARQLSPCAPTAMHAILADDAQEVTFYTDFMTGIPVVRKGTAHRGKWIFLAPSRLPDRAQLRSVILQDTVWVRTADRWIYPGPCTSAGHLWWGPGGGDRPTEAAWVISQLLDDVGSEVTLDGHGRRAPDGLRRLLNQPLKPGTELMRAELEQARAQRADDVLDS